jgi:hypothetical protein
MKLITNNFKTNLVKMFISHVDDNTSYRYLGAHRSLKYPNDSIPPDIANDVYSTHYQLHNELLFGKHITANDVKPMIRNVVWTSGTVYTMYDSQTADLDSTNFYVVTFELGEYHVFKCLNNNGGVPSVNQPKRSQTSPRDQHYRTNDGYEWKYMYTVSPTDYLKFATPSYFPVVINSDVSANAVPGAIDTIVIEDAGLAYRNFATGVFKESGIDGNSLMFSIESNVIDSPLSADDYFYENSAIYIDNGPGDGEIRTITDYFVQAGEKIIVIDSPFNTIPDKTSSFIISPNVYISGDGKNARARSVVNANTGSIEELVIVDRGSDYTYASIEVIGSTGTSALTTVSTVVARAIISPPNGHGYDPINELYATRVGVGMTFAGTESGTIPATNDYRKISIIKDPLFNNVQLTLNALVTGFGVTNTISQASSGAKGTIATISANTVILNNVHGFFEASTYTLDESNNRVYDTSTAVTYANTVMYIDSVDQSIELFDQRSVYQVQVDDDGPLNTGFLQDEIVVQSGLNKTLSVDLIKLTLDGVDSSYYFTIGETITQNTASNYATGTVVGRAGNVLTVSAPSSYFAASANVVGSTSGSSVKVTDYDNTFDATATGAVHEITLNAGTTGTGTIALTSVNGTFTLSDTETNTINSFKGQTSQAVAKLNGLDTTKPKVVDGSGEFTYVENFVAITRDPDQTERIKLIIEF